jgi:2,4-dienoyl-CoA reductase-like NADH-dependent reductase (Old Yellow Enzyme family)
MRFSVEVVQAVAAAVSSRFIVGFRMTGDPRTTVTGMSPDDMLAIFTGYREARSALGDALLDAYPDLEVALVGDCLAPRRLHDAVAEGARAGNAVSCLPATGGIRGYVHLIPH